jgi:hypothetical protein
VKEELYRITFAGNLCPPHEVIALGFRDLWRPQSDGKDMWPPRRIVSELSDTPFANLCAQLEEELSRSQNSPQNASAPI